MNRRAQQLTAQSLNIAVSKTHETHVDDDSDWAANGRMPSTDSKMNAKLTGKHV